MTVIMEENKKKDDVNIIDESFKEYVGKIKPPNNHKEWWDYIGIMWANAFSMGITESLKAFEEEIKKAKEEK